MRTRKVREVFVAGGMPSHTYVPRNELRLESTLRNELNEGYKIVCVTGPTKSGKTVLCRQVLKNDSVVSVPGGQIYKSEEFWTHILSELDLPLEETISGTESLSAGLRSLVSLKAKVEEGTSARFGTGSKRNILRYLRDHNICLMVDDFHYMPSAVQREVVRSLKSEIFEGLRAVLIAAPHRAFDAINVEREMEGRFAHIEIPSWSRQDLELIPELGFPLLNLSVPPEVSHEFA